MRQLTPDDFSSELAKNYEYYQDQMKRYLAKRSHNKEDADDYYQDIFLNILENSARKGMILPQTDDHLNNWLYRIVRNLEIDDYRRNKKIVFQPLPENEAYTQLPELSVEEEAGTIDRLRLLEVLAQMPPRYQQCVLLKYDYGYKQKEIATKLGISEAAVGEILRNVKTQVQSKYYTVPIDLQRAEALHAQQAIADLLRDVKGVVNRDKLEEYCVRALDWQFRQHMKKHSGELRDELRTNDPFYRSCTLFADHAAKDGTALVLDESGQTLFEGLIHTRIKRPLEYFTSLMDGSYRNNLISLP